MKYIFYKSFNIGNNKIRISWRDRDNFMGRFGGGWQWKLGIQVGSACILLSLIVLEITFWREHKQV